MRNHSFRLEGAEPAFSLLRRVWTGSRPGLCPRSGALAVEAACNGEPLRPLKLHFSNSSQSLCTSSSERNKKRSFPWVFNISNPRGPHGHIIAALGDTGSAGKGPWRCSSARHHRGGAGDRRAAVARTCRVLGVGIARCWYWRTIENKGLQHVAACSRDFVTEPPVSCLRPITFVDAPDWEEKILKQFETWINRVGCFVCHKRIIRVWLRRICRRKRRRNWWVFTISRRTRRYRAFSTQIAPCRTWGRMTHNYETISKIVQDLCLSPWMREIKYIFSTIQDCHLPRHWLL